MTQTEFKVLAWSWTTCIIKWRLSLDLCVFWQWGQCGCFHSKLTYHASMPLNFTGKLPKICSNSQSIWFPRNRVCTDRLVVQCMWRSISIQGKTDQLLLLYLKISVCGTESSFLKRERKQKKDKSKQLSYGEPFPVLEITYLYSGWETGMMASAGGNSLLF